MEVPGNLGQLVARLGELEQGPLEQVVVICFELDAPSVPEHLSVTPQKRLIGQAAAGVLHRRPGVAEVDVQQVYLVRGKVVAEAGGVAVNKKYVGQPHISAPLHGDDHGVGYPLHRHIQALRMGCGGLGGKAPLAAPKLQPEQPRTGHLFPPGAPHLHRVLDPQRRTDLHPCFQVLFLSHPHGILISLYNFKNQYTINYCKEQENRL